MRFRPCATALLLALSGCDHSGSFLNSPADLGPSGTSDPVRLTFNPEQDYWPSWTEDGRGILYSFVNPGSTAHRCIGLLPALGGRRIWELCDNGFGERDSVSSFPAYALGSDGRLLYVEAVAPRSQPSTPVSTTLWLADSSAPFSRVPLLALPTFVGATGIAWLSDIAWTGPNNFIALAQGFAIEAEPLPPCDVSADSVFANTGLVVTGAIASGKATVQAVDGTAGATGYSLAENGASIVFTTRGDAHLYKVPAGGGAAVAVTIVSTARGEELFGVSCQGSQCVVASSPVSFPAHLPAPCHFADTGPRQLSSVSLATGTVQQLKTSSDVMVASQISPVTGDVVVQIGGNLGHIQTSKAASNGDLYLYRGLIR